MFIPILNGDVGLRWDSGVWLVFVWDSSLDMWTPANHSSGGCSMLSSLGLTLDAYMMSNGYWTLASVATKHPSSPAERTTPQDGPMTTNMANASVSYSPWVTVVGTLGGGIGGQSANIPLPQGTVGNPLPSTFGGVGPVKASPAVVDPVDAKPKVSSSTNPFMPGSKRTPYWGKR